MLKYIVSFGVCGILGVCLSSPAMAGTDWKDVLKEVVGEPQVQKKQADPQPQKEAAVRSGGENLSNGQMTGGVKDALLQGVRLAIGALGKEGGFLNNPKIKIPMPQGLSQIESGLRRIKQGALADEFVKTMNRAAEQAVPETLGILTGAVDRLTIEDALKILQGSDDALTRYFQESSSEQLLEKILPIVKQATDQTGVTTAYKSLTAQVNLGMLGSLLGQDSLDIDRYVAERSLDGLFKYIAIEEKRIRDDPSARATNLLKDVFGAFVNR
ncbi:MAG: DUF4197 domain-containing protein [Gammaproteobacteria bacterium]|nr:DUF4197 domain-containing protein [Gammaproteobacteria bacterium]